MQGCASAFVVGLAAVAQAQVDLQRGFPEPPPSARPHTWWHWMNGNVTREGITADLEAMARFGIGGAQVFNVSESIPEGPVRFMSKEWLDLAAHAAAEADRVGLELCLHNCAGWSSSGGPWITPENAMQMVVVSETRAAGGQRFSAALPQPETRVGYYRDIATVAFRTPPNDTKRIPDIKAKAGYEARYDQRPVLDPYPADTVVPRGSVVDLTGRLGEGGRLTWDAPPGEWTILRFGHTPTGKDNHPSPESGRGLEVDKLSRAAFDTHWDAAIAPVLTRLGPLAGRTLNNALIDSYEVGHQNWTARFREEFAARRGYDLLPYLPVLTGRVVETGEVSERFLWDFRRTIADLFADNYYTYFAERCHAAGMLASIEPYDGPFECLLTGRDADIPMGEFWVGGGESGSCKLAASVAHTYGRSIVGAEAFTASPQAGRWQNHPASLKAIGDLMYTVGINRYIFHRYAHQPWTGVAPGMTMGQWGTHFDRTNTWWEQGAAWTRYLSRCQFVLQQGLFGADACFFAGEAAPNGAPHDPALKARGYDYDACNADVLLRRMSVKDGRLVLPDGMTYRLLVLPETTFMTPAIAGRIRDLVREGATVVGPRPERSPSLAGYPACDEAVRTIAGEAWGDADGKDVKQHTLGKGRIVWGMAAEEVLASMGVAPDCTFGRMKMAWIHRVVDGADVYFVSNQRERSDTVECSFRITGKAPELWHPDTGVIEPAPVWHEKGGRTTVAISFDPFGSVFVVFRRPAGAHLVAVRPPQAADAAAAAPEIEIRHAMYEAVDGAGGADVTAIVKSLVAQGETSIPANNATFGDPTYNHVKRLRVRYTVDGVSRESVAPENGTLDLAPPQKGPALPAYRLVGGERPELVTFATGRFAFESAGGSTSAVEVKALPMPLEITGPWRVRFQEGRGAPKEATFPALISWPEHEDPGVRYFSGTAEYEARFEAPGEWLTSGRAVELDLGEVGVIAEVSLNGTDLGVWWKPPFAADVSRALRPGANTLTVRVTNLWVNRLIGDEQLPDDCEWNGKPLKAWPEWFVKGTPRPSKDRITFTTWRHFTKDSPLLPSGLLGPVRVRVGERVPTGD